MGTAKVLVLTCFVATPTTTSATRSVAPAVSGLKIPVSVVRFPPVKGVTVEAMNGVIRGAGGRG